MKDKSPAIDLMATKYEAEILEPGLKPDLEKTLVKLGEKNKSQVEIILKNVDEILENPQKYGNLHKILISLQPIETHT